MFILSLLISSAWLVFPYLIQGKKMLQDVGDHARLTKAATVSRYLTRQLINHSDLELTATFATNEFFQYIDQANTIGQVRPDLNFIFFVGENIHTGSLTYELPEVTLHIGDEVYYPATSSGPNNAEHHRITIFSFPKRDTNNKVIDLNTVDNIRLHVSNYYLNSERKLTFVANWQGPYELPEALTSRADITPIATLALGAGLLSSVLTPCLLQLVVIFGSIVSGFSTLPGQVPTNSASISKEIRRKILQVALAFVAGFVVLYMLAGAVIGAIGYQAQMLFSEYSRTVATVSGIIVILMGLWVGFRGTQDYACKLVDRDSLRINNVRDMLGAMAVSMGYALGCTACFGGAIVATLIIYVGSIGSASIGAAIMFCFSIGVAIPFLASAFYISRMESMLLFFAEKSRPISILSMLLIITFGIILITDNFHYVSDSIYPYLGLN